MDACAINRSKSSDAPTSSGIPVPDKSYRRNNEKLTINGKSCAFLLATDELEEFLWTSYGEPENVTDLAKTRDPLAIKSRIRDRPGLLIFRHGARRAVPPKDLFEHAEIWNGSRLLQGDMAGSLFSNPRVLLWDSNDPAKWLTDFMKTQS